jgi:hypothetical protein
MSRSVLLLATVHEFQGPGFAGYVEDRSYTTGIESCIRSGRVDFVFEEAAGQSPSIAERYAKSLLQPGHYLDVDCGRIPTNPFITPKPICGFTSVTFAEHRKREELWLQRMNGQEFKKALLVCGVGHSLSFAFRLQDNGFSVEFCQHLPYEKLCRRQHAT